METLLQRDKNGRILYTKEMNKDYTILIPMMAPIHFTLMKNIFVENGYKMELLDNTGPSVVQEGLKYVHNDTCYPALLVIGQMIDALNSGKYDLNKTALMITQTGGGCRASNYIHLLRKALVKAGYENIPVISLNFFGSEKNSGFKMSISIIRKLLAAIAYGDMLMLLNNQVRPYELCKGDSLKNVDFWIDRLSELFAQNQGFRKREFKTLMKDIVLSFSDIERLSVKKIKVGVVGEIFVKYSAIGNNNLEDFLHEQDCEIMIPGIMCFVMIVVDNRIEDTHLYGGSKVLYNFTAIIMNYLSGIEDIMIEAILNNSDFLPPSKYHHVKALAKGVIGYGNKMGEGWLLTAEMLELIESGYENIICTQPFGCLPNHIIGKGMIRKIKGMHDNANIVAIDYDPSATKVNQENRIKLMLSVANEQMNAMPQEVKKTSSYTHPIKVKVKS